MGRNQFEENLAVGSKHFVKDRGGCRSLGKPALNSRKFDGSLRSTLEQKGSDCVGDGRCRNRDSRYSLCQLKSICHIYPRTSKKTIDVTAVDAIIAL